MADPGRRTARVGGEKVSKKENLMGGGADHAYAVLHTQHTLVQRLQHDSLAMLRPGQCVKLD